MLHISTKGKPARKFLLETMFTVPVKLLQFYYVDVNVLLTGTFIFRKE